jgi:hypothetical protein
MAEIEKKEAANTEKPGHRLTPVDRSRELLPWRRASQLTRCCLYWLPVSAFPMPGSQRLWLMEFLDRWGALMGEQFSLRAEVFLQFKTVYPDLMPDLLDNMMELIPVMGLGIKPGTVLPVLPSKNEVEGMMKDMFKTLQQDKPLHMPDSTKYMPDYAYWFVDKSERKQRELFFGHGGLGIAFLRPDPKTVPLPLPLTPAQKQKLPFLQQIDMDKSWAQAHSLRDGFLPKSKEFFSAGLEKEPQMKGIPFIFPVLDSADFFSQPPEVIEKCFQLFEVYIRESPADKGILLAFTGDLEEKLIELVRVMKDQKLIYPEA